VQAEVLRRLDRDSEAGVKTRRKKRKQETWNNIN